MAIWFKEVSLATLNYIGKNTMVEFLDIRFIEMGDDFLKATMPVNERLFIRSFAGLTQEQKMIPALILGGENCTAVALIFLIKFGH